MHPETYERLKRLAEAGDTEAALRLERQAQRHHDPQAVATAAITLDDAAELAQLIDTAWRDQDWDQVHNLALRLGFTLTPSLAASIDTRIRKANGRRRVRLMTRPLVLIALYEARLAPDRIAFQHTVPGQQSHGKATVALAVRVDTTHHIRLDVAACRAANPKPSNFSGISSWSRIPTQAQLESAWRWGTRIQSDDAIVIPTLPLPRPLKNHAAKRAQDARPLIQLEELLGEPPSEALWTSIIQLITTLRHHREDALELAHPRLEAWPPRLRSVGRSYLRDLHKKAGPAPWLPLFRHLRLDVAPGDLERLDHPLARHLRMLTLVPHPKKPITRQELAQLTGLQNLPHLEVLFILNEGRRRATRDQLPLSPDTLARFSTAFPALRILELDFVRTGNTGIATLLSDPALELERLSAHAATITRFPSTPNSFARLQHLSLQYNRLGPLGTRSLAAWPGLDCVHSLDLRFTDLDDDAIVALMASPHLQHLQTLALTYGRGRGTEIGFGPTALRALLDTHLPQLRRIELPFYSAFQRGIDRGLVQALSERFEFPRVHGYIP